MLPKILITVLLLGVSVFFISGFISHRDEIIQNIKPQSNTSCPNPLILQTPVDLNKVTSILYPGQVRGGDFKPHGGFRFDNSKFDEIEVRAPLDGVFSDGSRYIEHGEVQYMFDFQNSCGIRYRFDHLLVLAPRLAKIADSLPQPKENDSRTTQITENVAVTKGEIIATAVGFRSGNVFVDFGVYDISKQGFFTRDNKKSALCWFDLLSASDSAKVKSLPPADSKSGSQSTLCKSN